MGAALCVKLLVVPAAIPIGVLWLGSRPRRVRDGVRRGGGRDRRGARGALPWGIDRVWDQSVAYHRDSERLRSYGGNAWTLVATLAERDPFVLAVAVGRRA